MSEEHFIPLTPQEAELVGYERTEPNAFKIGFLSLVIVATIIGSCYLVYFWYVGQLEYARHEEIEVPVWQDIKDVRAYETERLTQYKYIDKTKGSVQLPISRSMELLIQEASAGKSFYGGANAPVKPAEVDPNLQTVLNKALGLPPPPPPPVDPKAAAATPAAHATPAAPAAPKH